MDKIEQRKAMKALAIASHITAETAKAKKAVFPESTFIMSNAGIKAVAMARTDATLFCSGKPKLDKRRLKRRERSQEAWIIGQSIGGHTDSRTVSVKEFLA